MRTIDDILPTVQEATAAGKLQWKENNIPDSYLTQIGPFSVLIWQWQDNDDDTFGYSVQLLRGPNVLDTARSSQYGSKFGLLEAVFEGARRSFLNVDEVIADLEGELAKLMK
ncbi:hypothetical protein AB9F45_27680 [Rhizobium leguminosarum]|uniref:hypothetical protein n=1 Tax=Rhizobium leguminosarum TaxID=384 RepID=UPI003F94DEEA